MTTKEILLGAAEYIKVHGHRKHKYGGRFWGNPDHLDNYGQMVREDCPACIWGAIAAVANTPNTLDVDQALRKALPEGWGSSPIAFNDEFLNQTTAVEYLQRAAEMCE